MDGVITGKHVATHARLIWREYGFRCLFRCVKAVLFGPRTTFLEIVWEKTR